MKNLYSNIILRIKCFLKNSFYYKIINKTDFQQNNFLIIIIIMSRKFNCFKFISIIDINSKITIR